MTDNLARIADIRSTLIIKNQQLAYPLVSIVIPTYKRAGLLKAAIESCLTQKNAPLFDVIVVDDNPERNCDTEELMKSIADDRVSYYKNTQNLGQINNWNRCFELATGKWVAMLHDDDLLLEFFLRDCFAILNKDAEIGLLKPQWHHWIDDGCQPPYIADDTNTDQIQRVYEIDQLLNDSIGAPTGIVINRDKFFRIGGFNPDFFPTADKCFVTLFAYYFKVYKLNKTASIYRFFNNDSLKTEVLQGFLRNDFFLFKQLCSRCAIPGVLANNFLGHKLRNITGYYQHINPAFSFDKSSIGLTEPNKIVGKIAYKLTDKIVLAYQKYYKLFGWVIFKTRQLDTSIQPIAKRRAVQKSAGMSMVALALSQFFEEACLVFLESSQTLFSL